MRMPTRRRVTVLLMSIAQGRVTRARPPSAASSVYSRAKTPRFVVSGHDPARARPRDREKPHDGGGMGKLLFTRMSVGRVAARGSAPPPQRWCA